MGSEKREIHSKLVEHYPELFSGGSAEPWDIGSSERMASVSQLQDHLQGSFQLSVFGQVIASPIRSVPLGPNEEAPRQHERPILGAVPLEQALERGFLLKASISIVYISVLIHLSICCHMNSLQRNRLGFCLEDRGLVHVVPDQVQMIGTHKVCRRVQVAPELLGVFVEEVDPVRKAWPAFTDEWFW